MPEHAANVDAAGRPKNKVRAALDAGRVPVQVFCITGSTFVADTLVRAGYDSILFDMQHGPFTVQTLFDLVMVAKPTACPMVRVPSAERGGLERAVEAGVHGVICPSVESRAEAESVVEACRASTLADVMAIVQIESVAGFENVEEILTTPGLDAVLPGPSDLSVAFGGPPGLDYVNEPSVGRLRHILAVAKRTGIRSFLPALDPRSAQTLLNWGCDWIAYGGDLWWLQERAQSSLSVVREVINEHQGENRQTSLTESAPTA